LLFFSCIISESRAPNLAMSATIVAATSETIVRAADLLRDGRLVAFPTETVYGLCGDATGDQAVAEIFAAKRRPRFNPLIVHAPGLAEAEAIARFDDRARAAARQFWPGPLSLVLPRRQNSGVSLLACAGLDTVAVRVPAHPVAAALLRAAGRPIAAPSANRSGRLSPTTAQHVAAEFACESRSPSDQRNNVMPGLDPGIHAPAPDAATPAKGVDARVQPGRDGRSVVEIALILDGGATQIGLESTVLDLTGPAPVLLRPGGITLEALRVALGPIVAATGDDDAPRSPGRLASHYAPALPVRLDAVDARPGEALLALGPQAPPGFAEVLFLSHRGDLVEAAANLFAMLRRLDRAEFSAIAVMPIPEEGLGRAINDRLRRAAAPRANPDR
jgi:L-threonylcarbamoyladenylate synthase